MNELGSILITGGAGFFAKAFVRHLLDNNLSDRICIYSRDEYKHAVMRDELRDDSRLRFLIGDVRDLPRLKRAMHGVDVVVHAAALKRIEVGAYCPSELLKTNVIGSQNVIDACLDEGVNKCVFLSTDKAYHAKSAYGHSKALAECLFLAANNMSGKDGTKFSVTRYGNVAFSTGSIIPRWLDMEENGHICVPVTDPECTRFYMTADEAVNLVLDTIEAMVGGELVIPELPAFSIGDLAEAMSMDMKILGLPEWEKMHESMDDDNCSEDARRMSAEELREAIYESS